MNTTLLAQLMANLHPDQVLYGLSVADSATVYTVDRGVIYMHRMTTTGHGYKAPQVSDRAAWARVAGVCAWTAPANPATMHVGLAGARLGKFWAALPDTSAERRVTVPELVRVASNQPQQ